jgi:protein-L-isoaspartate(D-aspartate) O-methyltransferase
MEPGEWPQALIEFTDRHTAEQTAVDHLRPALADARQAGLVADWFFIRKSPHWRLRYRPTDDRAPAHLADRLNLLTRQGQIVGWAAGIYEPEVVAFGGTDAMAVAHEMFCRDSRHILDYLARSGADTRDEAELGRPELATLLCTVLMRGAGQDWYEQGDVWARVASHRPPGRTPSTPRRGHADAAMYRLMTVDASPTGRLLRGPLCAVADWVAAFEHAGQRLAALARLGALERGLRAVLTHHVIFHFNRLGLLGTQQSSLAQLAKEVVMTDPETAGSAPLTAAGVGDIGTRTADLTSTAHRLRHRLVDDLRERGVVVTEAVEDALRTVPRHLFVPGVAVEVAYADDPIYTKHDRVGVSVSAASQPTVVAMMLEQLAVEPGQRVLEIGTGTGYNAALLAHLVGPRGHVTTIDVDDDLVDGARTGLRAAGHGDVSVILGDGAVGHVPGAPYDRVIATVGAWDLPPAWREQLAPRGRLVVPLRLRGSVSRSVVFEHDEGRWLGRSSQMCTFMPLRGGVADDPRRVIALAPEDRVTLQTHREQTVDAAALAGVFDHPRSQTWTGVLFRGPEPFEWLDLWLACTMTNALSRMPVRRDAIDSGLVTPQFGWGAMATIDKGNLAYLTLRPTDPAATTDRRYEVGVAGHGPGGDELAGRVADAIRTWDRDYRSRTVHIELQPIDTTSPIRGQFVFHTPRNRLAITWT